MTGAFIYVSVRHVRERAVVKITKMSPHLLFYKISASEPVATKHQHLKVNKARSSHS